MAENLESVLLRTVEHSPIECTYQWSLDNGYDHNLVIGTMKSLLIDGYVREESITTEFWQLMPEAESYIEKGSPEVQVFHAIPEAGATEAELKEKLGAELVKIGMGKCMKNKWINRDKSSGLLTRAVSSIDKDELVDELKAVQDGKMEDQKALKQLKQRQLINLV